MMLDIKPELVPSKETDAVKKIKKLLMAGKKTGKTINLSLSNGEKINLPETLTSALLSIVDILLDGGVVEIQPLSRYVSPVEAAELLSVPTRTVEKLMQTRHLPYIEAGDNVIIDMADVNRVKTMLIESAQRSGLMPK